MDTIAKAVHYDAKVQELDMARAAILHDLDESLELFREARERRDQISSAYERGRYYGLLAAALFTGAMLSAEYSARCQQMIDAIKEG